VQAAPAHEIGFLEAAARDQELADAIVEAALGGLRDGGNGCNGGHGVLMFCDGYFDPTANCSIPDARAR
jgi:hypothetical protein